MAASAAAVVPAETGGPGGARPKLVQSLAPMHVRSFATLVAFGLVVACSGGTDTVGNGSNATVPEGATSQQCATFEACPSIACECGKSIVNARRCIEGYCLDESHTCSSACGDDSVVKVPPGEE